MNETQTKQHGDDKAEKFLSIIIPAYNTEKFIHQCLDSILNQITNDIEVIIINDGSTDSTGDICDYYYELCPAISVIHQPNMGPGAARNSGINISRGKYIWFVDSDDYITENAIKKIRCNLIDGIDVLLVSATSFV